MLSLFLQLFFFLLHAAHYTLRLSKRLIPSLSSPAVPLDLDTLRTQPIEDLALVLVTSSNEEGKEEDSDEAEALIECVKRVAGWCRLAGVETLTIYERKGATKYIHWLCFF